jgi:hypothetical protein
VNDRSAKHWRFEESESLDLMIEAARPRGVENVWGVHAAGAYHVRRLGRFVSGDRVTDAEDLEMASILLNIAARQFERREEGRMSPCAVSAEYVGRMMLSRKKAGSDPLMDERMKGTAARLAARAGMTKENDQPEN